MYDSVTVYAKTVLGLPFLQFPHYIKQVLLFLLRYNFYLSRLLILYSWLMTPLVDIALALNVVESITFKIASAVSRFVKLIIPCSTDSLLIRKPSERGCLPKVCVFITNCTFPSLIKDNKSSSSAPICPIAWICKRLFCM